MYSYKNRLARAIDISLCVPFPPSPDVFLCNEPFLPAKHGPLFISESVFPSPVTIIPFPVVLATPWGRPVTLSSCWGPLFSTLHSSLALLVTLVFAKGGSQGGGLRVPLHVAR